MSEHDEQVALFDYLRLHEHRDPRLKWIHAIPNGGKRHPGTARKMKAEGVKAGVWDVFVPYPIANIYHGMYIEMKFGKNKLTDSQRDFYDYAERAGYKCVICYTWQNAAKEIASYLNIYWLWEGLG